MVVRYMGTKRHMADSVAAAITSANRGGRAVDLFSGMGSVAESLAGSVPVSLNDAFGFVGSLSRARFMGRERSSNADNLAEALEPAFLSHCARLRQEHSEQLEVESESLADGQRALLNYFAKAKHAGNSVDHRRRARVAAETAGEEHYQLASLYYSAGYLSLAQAIEVDALRFAVDSRGAFEGRDWALGAITVAMSHVLNAPGHTAQYMRPNSIAGHARVLKSWSKSIWTEFSRGLHEIAQVGNESWRSENSVHVGDALDFLNTDPPADVGVVYADPPYTKDQYSRFYHLYETAYRYDYPDSNGSGRVRSDRFSTGFSLKSNVRSSFHQLCRSVARIEVPLVVSYPANGLLSKTGTTFDVIAANYFDSVRVESISASHSTLGASRGESNVQAIENIYICEFRTE